MCTSKTYKHAFNHLTSVETTRQLTREEVEKRYNKVGIPTEVCSKYRFRLEHAERYSQLGVDTIRFILLRCQESVDSKRLKKVECALVKHINLSLKDKYRPLLNREHTV